MTTRVQARLAAAVWRSEFPSSLQAQEKAWISPENSWPAMQGLQTERNPGPGPDSAHACHETAPQHLFWAGHRAWVCTRLTRSSRDMDSGSTAVSAILQRCACGEASSDRLSPHAVPRSLAVPLMQRGTMQGPICGAAGSSAHIARAGSSVRRDQCGCAAHCAISRLPGHLRRPWTSATPRKLDQAAAARRACLDSLERQVSSYLGPFLAGVPLLGACSAESLQATGLDA